MNTSEPQDKSNGYEEIAEDFLRARNLRIGPAVVRDWSRSLAPGAAVLDLGCGFGAISQVLLEDGFTVYGVDASPSMIRAFKERFPEAPAECAAVEDSAFFHRTFDAIVAWGLIFLLSPDTQQLLIRKAAKALQSGGRFLFTAPREAVTWEDGMTGLESISLGASRYDELLQTEGLTVTGHDIDEGDNYYFFASRL
jgi:2-polyprenyl-3-methyl-5-hydroxy-6-metoxy-1,4-benzoquinol methylase